MGGGSGTATLTVGGGGGATSIVTCAIAEIVILKNKIVVAKSIIFLISLILLFRPSFSVSISPLFFE
ncbi:MAG: hypothetical protein ACXWMC_02555, partial [Syntrophales bacterium]